MTGPQGSDPTQPYPGSDQPADAASEPTPDATGWQPPATHDPSTTWQQTPAYTPPQYSPYAQPGYQQPQQYPDPGAAPGYQQPGAYGVPQYGQQQYGQPQYPQYGQQPGAYGAPQYGQPPYGQPGQPQYGQPGQYGAPQYGQLPPEEGAANKSKAALVTILGVLAALVVIAVLILGFWKPGFFMTTKLDVNKAQQGVQQILTDQANGYGAKNVQDVKCNNGQNPTVRKGDTFTCEVSVDGTKRQVTVTFQDDKGTYEVGRPK
jgi:hypothetical protein